MATGHHRSSIVWKFYTASKDDGAQVECKLCDISLSRGGKEEKSFNTTNLRKHLQSKHKQELEKEQLLVTEENNCLKNKRKLN